MTNEDTTTPGAISELVTVMGGVELEIAYLDGTKETVKVRQIPVRRMENYLMAIDNEPAAVELFCDRKNGWSEKLTEESFNAIAEKGQEINLPFFGPWLRRRLARLEVMKPGFATSLDSVMKTAIESALQSRDSSRQPV